MANITMTISKEGLQDILGTSSNSVTQADYVFRALGNNVTITEATILSDLTEATNIGNKTLTGANWTQSYTTKGVNTYTEAFSLTATGATTVYGGYITNSANTVLISGGNFSAPKVLDSADTIDTDSIVQGLDNV